jgi:hypothetical protein
MPITQQLNSKAIVKKSTSNDMPFSPAVPVISSFYGTSTASQTVINLGFTILTSGVYANTDIFFLFIDGKKLRLGSSNDYTFTSINSDGTSSQVTLNSALVAGLNIQAYKLGLKPEVQFQMDNRFTQLYSNMNSAFQGFVSQTDYIMTATTTTGTPASGTFYSSIPNRASIVDISQDLKARMGVERKPLQNIYPIQTEFGASNEPIWGVLNDTFGQVRLGGGGWQSYTGVGGSVNGEGVFSNNSGDYIEITFYGTGVNLLLYLTNSARTFTVSVDGVSTTSVSPSTTSTGTILNGRNYNQNIVTNIVRGLTAGVHTVKIALSVGTDIDITAYEVLNESSNILINSGIGYIQGQKIVNSSQTSIAYNNAVTGTRGGRVLIYQQSSGAIGEAFTAVATSASGYGSYAGTGYSGNAPSHTNEEIARTYFFREFGAGRADDFSRILASSTNAAFTLEDGTTTVVGQNVQFNNNGLNSSEGEFNNGTGDFTTITFVGTGIDLINAGNASGSMNYTYSFTVDGTLIASGVTGSTFVPATVIPIVSGLPYGTHTLKIITTASSSTSFHLKGFIVYQPKTPTLPSGSIQLATYNVFANYVANSTQSAINIAQGVLRKASMRELNLTGSWAFSGGAVVQTNSIMGWELSSPASASSCTFQFFGTGFEYRAWNNTGATTYTISIDGAVNTQVANSSPTGGAGWSSALTTSFYGSNFSYANTTGVVTLSAGSGTSGCGVSINGMTLGWHTITVTWASGSGSINVEAFDIITPIHSFKSDLYGDLQNSLPVGSNAISDDRATAAVAGLSPTKAWAQAVGITTSPTTTSTAFVPLPDMSVTIKTSGGSLEIFYSVSTSNSSNTIFTQIYVDSIPVSNYRANSSGLDTMSDCLIWPVGAGTHKVDVYWEVNSGTGTANQQERTLVVKEI